jgi:hypothetical protein
MPFNITIKNLTEHQMGDLFARVGNKGYDIQVHYTDANAEDSPTKQGGKRKTHISGRIAADEIVLLGDIEEATPGSLYEKITQIMQRLEKKDGIGTVTKKMLSDALGKHSAAPGAAISVARRRGIIKRGKKK